MHRDWFAHRPFDFTATSSSSSFILYFKCYRAFSLARSFHLLKTNVREYLCVLCRKCGAKNRTAILVYSAHTPSLMKNMSFKLYTQRQYEYAHRIEWTKHIKHPAIVNEWSNQSAIELDSTVNSTHSYIRKSFNKIERDGHIERIWTEHTHTQNENLTQMTQNEDKPNRKLPCTGGK